MYVAKPPQFNIDTKIDGLYLEGISIEIWLFCVSVLDFGGGRRKKNVT